MIVPLGFVSDHMEVLWDLDTEAMETAEEVGIVALRTPTPGVDPAYVSGLVDLVLERLHGTPAGWSQAGGAYDQVNLLSTAWASTGTPSAASQPAMSVANRCSPDSVAMISSSR